MPAALLQALAGSRTWDKELVMWVGSEKDLREALGTARSVTLDLLDLFEDEATGQLLRDELPQRLRAIPRGPNNRVILIVKSIGLLARYSVGLRAFYDWFIGDFAMVVLFLDGGVETVGWPEEVRCEGNRVLSYFSEPGMVKGVFNTSG
ncbi:MAG: hypothetical protein FJY85_19560 [Deltaproteobacteria bacterium]|nr:hypothetical protein [Deltaproteobacteria bacterium]